MAKNVFVSYADNTTDYNSLKELGRWHFAGDLGVGSTPVSPLIGYEPPDIHPRSDNTASNPSMQLRRADVMVVIWTSAAQHDTVVSSELTYANNNRIPIIKTDPAQAASGGGLIGWTAALLGTAISRA